MGLPPPLLRDFSSMVEMLNYNECEEQKVWEIGVPSRNSLYWSLILSCLLSNDDNRFSLLIDELKRDDSTGRKKKTKSLPSNVDVKDVKKRLKNFNPFTNRHVFFYDHVYIKILNAFKLKLKQFTYKMFRNEVWNDETQLTAAAFMLNCNINVYLPEEQRMISFQNKKSENIPTIVLFQYRDQKHGSRTENINVFHFAMSVQKCYPLKLNALAYILKKAKLSLEDSNSIQLLMHQEEAHGENFISVILQSPQYNILPYLYKSTYIAVKLSQSGFETNPAVVHSDKPTAFFYASTKADTKYFRILYDYAANCRYLFESTVHDPSETVLNSLKKLQDIFANDISKIHHTNYQIEIKEHSFDIQREFSRFNEYQQSLVAAILKLKNESSNQDLLYICKKYVQGILENYQEYFYYDAPKSDICEIHKNYLNFHEYYENIDYFSCISFLDFIYKLKKVFQLKDENIYAPIESTFFLLVVSNNHFPKFKHIVNCSSSHSKENCEVYKNLLRFIPLFYREALQQKIKDFLGMLNHHIVSPVPPEKIKDEKLRGSLSAFPEIVDELLIYRIRIYLTAAVDVSFNEDGIKGILVVERALQILGESLKPQSTVGCVVSCLLGSRLSQNIKRELINIRNDMSHYRDNSSEGRLAIEKDSTFFFNLQKEIDTIRKRLEIVAFTQYLRVEEFLVKNCKDEVTKQILEETINVKFHEACSGVLDSRKNNYTNFIKDCIELSLDVITDFIEYANYNRLLSCKKIEPNIELTIDCSLRGMEYIFKHMCRNINEEIFQPYLLEMQSYFQKYKKDKNIVTLIYDISKFFQSYKKITKRLEIPVSSCSAIQFRTLELFYNSLKQSNIIASDIQVIVQAVEFAYIEANNAKEELIRNVEGGSIDIKTSAELLRKLLISSKCLKNIEIYLKKSDKKRALRELKKTWTPLESMQLKMKKTFENNSIEDLEVRTLLIKLVYQRNLHRNIYTSLKLSSDICNKLDNFLMKRVNFFLSRIESMKSILIDDDCEVTEIWNWGRSVEIKHHMKFLMRQRFLREMPIRSSLEMAFFDCLNILKRDEFSDIYGKVNNLYAGINLRDVLSHGDNILETISGLLDEDDLPSEFINKILELIDDSEAIKSMQKLIPLSSSLESECFKSWMKEKEDEGAFKNLIKNVTRCSRWENYLFLLPLI